MYAGRSSVLSISCPSAQPICSHHHLMLRARLKCHAKHRSPVPNSTRSTDTRGHILIESHLVEELGGEGDAELGGGEGQAALAVAAARVERVHGLRLTLQWVHAGVRCTCRRCAACRVCGMQYARGVSLL